MATKSNQNKENDLQNQIPKKLIDELRVGNVDSRNQIALMLLIQVQKMCNYWAKNRQPAQRNDIRGAGSLGLLKGLKSFVENTVEDSEITHYVMNTVRSNITFFIRHDHLINVPIKQFKKQLAENGALPFLPHYKNINFEEYEPLVQCFETTESLLDALKLTPFERLVLELRLKEYTLREIADKVNKSHVWIHDTLLIIKEKYERYL